MITDIKINEALKKLYYERGYWGDKTIADVWDERCEKYGDRTYVQDDLGTKLTYKQVDTGARKLASWLKEVGVQNGDVVSFQVPKWADFCIIYLACLKVGAVMHPLATNLSANDIDYVINKVQSVVYICPTFFHKTDYENQYHGIESKLGSLKAVLLLDKEFPAHDENAVTLSKVLSGYSEFDGPCPAHSDDVCCILSTSGTTGKPKQAMFTHNNILFSERSYTADLDLTPDDVMWMPSPLNHATGFYHGLISPMLTGSRCVLQLHFKAAEAIELINREHVTWSCGATPFVHDLIGAMEENGTAIPSLRFYLCGGAPVPSTLIERAAEHGFLLCELYGSTESCPHLRVPRDKCLEWDGRFSGIAYPGIEVKVVDEFRNEVACGVQGEEASRGPHMFCGYLNDSERTNEALDDEGWFYSGDLCTIDEEERVRINGRKKEIIIRGGENISAREVDDNVMDWEDICDQATVGMPDDRLGERICLFAVPAPGVTEELCLHDLTEYLASKGVAKRLWPERIETIDAIPRTPTGKIKRFELAREVKRRMGIDQ